MTSSVQFTQHALALSSLSPEAAEECRRSVSRSSSRSDGSSSDVVRFHYEVGVMEPNSGALHLIQVCCQVCVEGRDCCKASVCCDAVCCQLQLPKGPQGPKRLIDEEEKAGGVASRSIEMPRTVAASASSYAGLASYPITARELMTHVAKCCDLCLDSKGAACCKKDCCAVSCCLVNVEVMAGPVGGPASTKASCCTTSSNKMGPVTEAQKPAKASPCSGSAACRTKDAVVLAKTCASLDGHDEQIKSKPCCAEKPSPGPALASSDGHKPASKCCTGEKNVIKAPKTCGSKDGSAGASPSSEGPPASHEDKPAPVVASCASSKCCTGKADEKSKTTTIASSGIKVADVESAKKPCSSASACCDTKVDEQQALLVITPPSAVKTPCGGSGVAAKGCCSTDASTTSTTCGGPKKDACASVDKSRAVLPVDVELAAVSTSISVSASSLLRISLQVSGMDCASCSKMVEDGVKRLESVRAATCSVMTGLAEVAYALDDGFDTLSAEQASEQTDAIVQQIAKLIQAMGYQCELLRSTVVSPNPDKTSASLMDETPALLVHLALITGEEGLDRDVLSSACTKLLLVPGVSSCTSRPHGGKSNSSSSLLLIGYQPDVVGARTLREAVEQHVGQAVSVVNSDEAMGGTGESDLAALWRTRFLICLLFTVPLFVIVYLLPAAGSGSDTMRAMHSEITSGLRVSSFVGFLLALPVQVYGGWPLYLSAYRAARFGHKLNIDALVALSTTVAFLYSTATTIASMAGEPLIEDVFFETSAVVLTVILLGRYLESIAKGKAAAALSELARMQVDMAMLVRPTAGANKSEKKDYEEPEAVSSSTTELIRTELLQRDDIVQVLPGTRIPTDGVIVFGSSSVDEAMLTGEARPVNKSIGDIVYGSTVNQRGMVHLRVTRVPGENALSGIMQLVRQAQSSTPPIQRVADAVAAYFVPAILALAVSIFILWVLLVEYGVVTTDLAAVTFAIKFAIATLVVSCPCAVGLAVPVPVMVASGVGAKLGVLFKSGPALEAFHKANVIVFDKTGTLTLGQPTVVQWRNLSSNGLSDRLLWWTVASAESGSEHVWAKAMLEYARSNRVDGGALAELGTPSSFEAVSGRGIRCSLNDQVVLIGNARWMEENGVGIVIAAAPAAGPARENCGEVGCGQPTADCCPPDLQPMAVNHASVAEDVDVIAMEKAGASIVYVAINRELAGWIALSDAVRPEAASVVKALEQLKVQVWILSGDAQTSTDAVASQLGIDPKQACGHLLPGDKAKRVQELQQQGNIVAMVGDGINDAPALTQADIGLTVMNGSDVAMGAADVVLMKDHLSLLLHALELSRATFSVIKLNLGWAFFYNLCAIPFAVGAFYTLNGVVLPPTFAGLAELLSSLPVILFAIALKWFKPKSLVEPM